MAYARRSLRSCLCLVSREAGCALFGSSAAAPAAASRTTRVAHSVAHHAGVLGAPSTTGFSSVTLKDLYKLSKGKLSMIVVATGAAGFVAGSGETIEYGKLAFTCIGTFACSAAANTLNQVYEIRNDGLMRRTMLRPLPAGRLSVAQALCFAAVTSIGGGALLAYEVRPSRNRLDCALPVARTICAFAVLASK